eukprot:scaffold413134_cov34-Prasinocladus_malaysianus.AAC.1
MQRAEMKRNEMKPNGMQHARVSGPLQDAKRDLLEHANAFASAKSWAPLLQYLEFAVEECLGLPSRWEKPSMNKPRETVAEQFGKHMEKALKQLNLSTEELEAWKTRLSQDDKLFSRALTAVNATLGSK